MVASLALLLGAGTASAASITVDTVDDDQISESDDLDCTLREAVEAANTNLAVDSCTSGDQGPALDTIQLGAGPYPLAFSGTDDTNVSGDLDVLAAPGAGQAGALVIDGEAGTIIDAPTSERVIHHLTGDLILTDLTVTGGSPSSGNGGGILSVGSNLTLTNVTVNGNQTQSGERGGGIYFAPASGSGTLTVTDSEVSDNLNSLNDSGDLGGGIAVGPNGDLTMTGSVVSGNDISENFADGSSHGGGGVWAGGSPPEITDSTISGNTVTAGPSTVTTATPSGGGVLFEGTGGGDITGTAITGNQVIDSNPDLALNPGGGGVSIQGLGGAGPEYSIVNSTIASNTVTGNAETGASWGGGGIYASPNPGQTVRVTHSTLSANESPRGDALGGGTFGTVTLKNSVFDDQDGTVTDTCERGAPSFISAGHNVAMGTTCVDGTGTGDQASTNPLLEPLGDFGGPTETAPPDVTSPAVDLVPAASCDDGKASPTLLTDDQRGFPRPFDGDADSTADCDAGAVEVYPCQGENATIASEDSNVTGTSGDDVILGLSGGGQSLDGGAGDDLLCGGAGSDNITGGADDDGLDGGGGDDSLSGFGGDDDYDGGNGNDRASFEGAPGGVVASLLTDTATGDGGTEALTSIERLTGSDNGGDTLTGDGGPPELIGANGDDAITGGGSSDEVRGDAGADQLFVRDGVSDQVDCGVSDPAADQVQTDAPGVDVLTNCLAPDVVSFPAVPPGPIGSCAGKTATVVGTAGAETLTGTPAADVIDAKGGNDVVRSLGGKDLVCGAAGNDKLVGGAGNDTLNGGAGKDRLKGGAGKDKLLGKGGKDLCAGGGGVDRGKGCERRSGIP